jgi:hypothetical protein
MNYLSAIGLKREALLDRRQGACIQGELATGGRALPERTEDCPVRTAHHRSVILFSWVRRVVENNFKGFFEPTGEGSGQLVSWRHGGKGDVSRHGAGGVPPSPLSQRLCSVPTLVPRFASERRYYCITICAYTVGPFLESLKLDPVIKLLSSEPRTKNTRLSTMFCTFSCTFFAQSAAPWRIHCSSFTVSSLYRCTI